MAREDGKKQRTTPRRKKMDDLYKSIKNDTYFDSSLMNEDNINKNNKLDDDRLYLYLTQNGRCMYTGKPLDINLLSIYHIDHIIPQSIIKDDSLTNRVLVTAKSNMDKSNSLVCAREDIPQNAKVLWESLFRVKLISKKKYYNLLKTVFTESDYRGFINRQLVETRQISKYVMNLFKDYNYTNHVVSVKAELSTLYRQANDLFKIRDLNDLHHAHDAYIACVVGRHIFDRQNKYLWSQYLQESEDLRFGFIIGGLLEDRQLADKVEKVLQYKNIFVTKKLEENSGESQGGFWNSTIYSKDNNKQKNKISLNNKSVDTTKYGYYSAENKAYSVAVYYKIGRKEYKKIIGIPVQIACLIRDNKKDLTTYLKESLKSDDVKIVKNKIFNNQLYEQDSSKYLIASASEIHTADQLRIEKKYYRMLYRAANNKITEKDIPLLTEFYYYFTEKIRDHYVKYQGIYKKLIDLKDNFIKLDLEEMCIVINNLLKVTKSGASQGDLSKLKYTNRCGRLNMQSINYDKIHFIDQSITGFYQKRYKIH